MPPLTPNNLILCILLFSLSTLYASIFPSFPFNNDRDRLLASFSDKSSLSGFYLKDDSIVYLEEKGTKSSYCDVDRCSIFNSPLSVFFRNTNASSTTLPQKYTSSPNSINECVQICQSLDQAVTKSSDTLLIFTTCNHLPISVRSLRALSSRHVSSEDSYDIVIIDDHSIDGTPDYFKKKGFFVIEKEQPIGLTHSWNIGYRIAKYLKYKYVIFANNDILVPHGAVDICRRSLVSEAIVVPMTTKKGAGHNPSQSISLVHSLAGPQNHFVNNPANFQLVQDHLDEMRAKADYRSKLLEKSVWNNKLKFNGFFFAVNVELIAPAAYDDDNLFDPGNIMVSQEDTLMRSMENHRLFPMISRYAFVYHFKSVTVQVAGHISGSKNETRNNLQHYHPELDSNLTVKRLPELYAAYHTDLRLPEMELYPPQPAQQQLVIGFIVPSKMKFSFASDLETVQALQDSLLKLFDVKTRIIAKSGYWYDLSGVDILVSLFDLLQFSEIANAKPTLISIAWLRTNYFRWASSSNLGAYDLLLLPSEGSLDHFRSSFEPSKGLPMRCQVRCPPFMKYIQHRSPAFVGVLRNAADSRINSLQIPSAKDFTVDYLLLVNAPMTDLNLSFFFIEDLKGAVLVGRRWKLLSSHGDGVLLKSLDLVARALQSAGLVLEHVNNDLFAHTSWSHNCLNALALGKTVLTNAKPQPDTFRDSLPSYSSLAEMKKLVKGSLSPDISSPNKNIKQTAVASVAASASAQVQQEVLSRHSFDQRADSLHRILTKNFNLSLPLRSQQKPFGSEITGGAEQSFCLLVQLKEASLEMLQAMLRSVMAQYAQLPSAQRRQLALRLFVLKPHFLSAELTSQLLHLIASLSPSSLSREGTEETDTEGLLSLQLFHDLAPAPPLPRRVVYEQDDIDHLLRLLQEQEQQQSGCRWMTIANVMAYSYRSDWLSSIAPSLLSQQHTLVTWNYLSNYSGSSSASLLSTEIDLSAEGPASLTALAERVPLGAMAFSWLSLQERRPLPPPPFMFLDSKFSSAALKRRVVRAILQATGTERRAHVPLPLMTRLHLQSEGQGEGQQGRLRREDQEGREGGGGFGNSLLVSLLGTGRR